MVNEKWVQQKNTYERSFQKRKRVPFHLSEAQNRCSTSFFGFLNAKLFFSRSFVRRKSMIENEMGLELIAVNSRIFTAINKGNK